MSHDESYQAMLLRRQREARKAYSASQELGEETEAQVESIMFVNDADGLREQYNCTAWGDLTPEQQAKLRLEIHEDDEQAQFLVSEGAWQERVEKAFCWGMMVGGATALTVLMGTLWWLGVV